MNLINQFWNLVFQYELDLLLPFHIRRIVIPFLWKMSARRVV